MKHLAYFLLAGICAAGMCGGADFHDWAKTPPMGWNSWDSFGCTITEAQVKEQADAEAKLLKPFGWTMFTVDIQWYHDEAKGHDYQPDAKLAMDEWGRLLPGPKRFPSSVNGAGFKPLADYVHAKGLTFGIHIMRGIARQAVAQNTPILGTSFRSADIANTKDTCPWHPNLYGVDMHKPGAQEYYDSLFKLYASWGVDFVKCDDISRPYTDGQALEIEAIRKAIDKTGRKIVLSLSPGETPLTRASHVARFANQWRISDDFWDQWRPLLEMFGRLHKWEVSRTPGSWPDADMLPLGKVSFGRDSRFTKDEQRTCMTLWCIARSPLILGGDMTRLDEWTLQLLTNPEVIAVNQQGVNPRQLSRDDNAHVIIWISGVPGSKALNIAFFNVGDAPVETRFALPELGLPINATARNLWTHEEAALTREIIAKPAPHGCELYRITPKQ